MDSAELSETLFSFPAQEFGRKSEKKTMFVPKQTKNKIIAKIVPCCIGIRRERGKKGEDQVRNKIYSTEQQSQNVPALFALILTKKIPKKTIK
jgi:hypothetical protein